MSAKRQYIVIDPHDNVATAIMPLAAGAELATAEATITLVHPIEFGHKFALDDIPTGAYVVKYGAPIGRATADIAKGDHVHVHNVADIVDEVRKG
ncbi:MAG: UxaA family hydrolase [Desulfobacterales bacterium]|nr:MAG: UxaA family hydrolase [Desulfobacterales bacterium]